MAQVDLVTIKQRYQALKQKADIAYLVFKHDASQANASRHINALQAFNKYCVEAMAKIAEDADDASNKEMLLANFNHYQTCNKCKSELLFQLGESDLMVSPDFIQQFPGWCYKCLVEYCTTHDCKLCNVATDADTCFFREVKAIYQEG